MEHVVFFPAHDGSPAFRRVSTLEEAVRLVEHLRNVEGVTEVSVHALDEVHLAFKAYYKVEMPSSEAAPQVETPHVEPVLTPVPDLVPAQDHAPEPAVEVPALAVAQGGRPTDGPSSLGFFAS